MHAERDPISCKGAIACRRRVNFVCLPETKSKSINENIDDLLLFCQTTQNDPNKKPRNIQHIKKLRKKDSSRLKSISQHDKFGVFLEKLQPPHVNGEHFPELPKQIWWFTRPDRQIWLCGHRLLGCSIACAIIMEPMRNRANITLYV